MEEHVLLLVVLLCIMVRLTTLNSKPSSVKTEQNGDVQRECQINSR